MKKKVRMVAIRQHDYDGRSLKPGDEYEADPSHAIGLQAAKAARRYESKEMKTVEEDSEPTKPEKASRYKHRSMKAED